MTQRAAIEGDYADFKIVKTRSVAQLVVEIPIEQAADMVRMFGVPVPGSPVRVAVARLHETPQIEATAAPANTNGHRSWGELSPAQQAGIRCAEPAFQKFLREEGDSAVSDTESAAAYVRLVCGVHSRAHLTGNAANLWHGLDARFQTWMHTA